MKFRILLATLLAVGALSAAAAPASAGIPCKIGIGSVYIANNPLCFIRP